MRQDSDGNGNIHKMWTVSKGISINDVVGFWRGICLRAATLRLVNILESVFGPAISSTKMVLRGRKEMCECNAYFVYSVHFVLG